jgi:hypothetical protein
MPSSGEVRRVLEELPEEGRIHVRHGGYRCVVEARPAKYALMYEYLTAGRISEVSGKYQPKRKHAIEMKIDGEPAVLFAHKTAKRKTKLGWLLRPIFLPLDPKYDPMVKRVYDYIKEYEPEEYPFRLSQSDNTSRDNLRGYAASIFDGMNWYFVDYLRSGFADPGLPYTYDPVSRRRVKITEETFKALGAKASYERIKGWTPIAVEIPAHWRETNTHELRKLRLRDLEAYDFTGEEQNIYAGWDEKEKGAAKASRHYLDQHPELQLDIGEDGRIPMTLAKLGRKYFPKLLHPVSVLLDSATSDAGGIEIIG